MDPVKKLNENFLSCSICTDRFTDPCTLGCGHTFCKKCLGKFMKSQQKAIIAKSIVCPICRQMTKTPNPTKPVEEWPKEMKPHHLIQGLLDEFGESAEAAQAVALTTGKLCFPCQQIGKTVQGGCLCYDCDVTLCDDCVKVHQIMPVTSHHAISDHQGEVKVKGRRKVICQEHKMVVEVFCQDCNKVMCHKCIIYHRKCNKLLTIESMVPEMKSAVKEMKMKVMGTIEEIQTSLALQQSTIESIGQVKPTVQAEIRRVSQQAIDLIKEKEKRLMDELDDATQKQTGIIRSQIKSGETDLQMYQQYSEFIDQALRSENHMDLYDVYQMCRSGAVKSAVDREMDISARRAADKIAFENKLQPQIFGNSFELGRLTKVQIRTTLTAKPVLQDTIDVNTESDSATSQPTDVIVLDIDGVDSVVVTDWGNKCLKSLYTSNGQKRIRKLMLNQKPQCISQLTRNQVTVSFMSHNEFFIVKVTPDLELLSTITTKRKYSCLTAVTAITLLAICSKPKCVDILDIHGQVIRSLTPLSAGRTLAYGTFSMGITYKGHILVSDSRVMSSVPVFCLTSEGDVIFTYTPEGHRKFKEAAGIAGHRSGEVFVCDYGDKKVIQLTERGEFVEEFLTQKDGLDGPYGICFYRDMLYVSDFNQGTVKCFIVSNR